MVDSRRRTIKVEVKQRPPEHIKQVTSLMTALLIGKLLYERHGDPTYINEAMERVMQDPQVANGIIRTCLNIIGQLAEGTQGKLEGYCMYFTKETMELQ